MRLQTAALGALRTLTLKWLEWQKWRWGARGPCATAATKAGMGVCRARGPAGHVIEEVLDVDHGPLHARTRARLCRLALLQL
eukprot:1827907-Rhodomonas_salina.3